MTSESNGGIANVRWLRTFDGVLVIGAVVALFYAAGMARMEGFAAELGLPSDLYRPPIGRALLAALRGSLGSLIALSIVVLLVPAGFYWLRVWLTARGKVSGELVSTFFLPTLFLVISLVVGIATSGAYSAGQEEAAEQSDTVMAAIAKNVMCLPTITLRDLQQARGYVMACSGSHCSIATAPGLLMVPRDDIALVAFPPCPD